MSAMVASDDSFEQFGDDLCEVILSYLTLDQCFRYECVSRQWKRCIFARQNRLEITPFSDQLVIRKLLYKPSDEYKWLFRRLIGKCVSLASVTIVDINDDIIDMIGDRCPGLRAITIDNLVFYVSPESWRRFGEKCGHSLRSIACRNRVGRESLQTLFRLTPCLVECDGLDLNDCVADSDGQKLLPSLRSVCADFTADSDFRTFADQYADRVEKISLTSLERYDSNLVVYVFDQLSRFESLQCLSIVLKPSADCDEQISRGLNLMARNCPHLRELTFRGFYYYMKGFPKLRENLLALQRLKIDVLKLFDSNARCLSCCPNLECLDINSENFDETGFADIHLSVPKLRAIRLVSTRKITDRTMKCLARLEELASIAIESESSITDNGLSAVINSCQNIRRINITRITSITKPTVDTFISRAKCNQKRNYALKTRVLHHDLSLSRSELKGIIKRLPINVEFDTGLDATAEEEDAEEVEEEEEEIDYGNDDYEDYDI